MSTNGAKCYSAKLASILCSKATMKDRSLRSTSIAPYMLFFLDLQPQML